jgi:16S rRNA (adenine1518-N6/adenine1519-N6)-dimethyltransferase
MTASRARKRFGQHFLEPAWVDKVIRAIDPKPDETFIEIGPGRGALTSPLAARAHQVIVYEIDRDLAAALRGSAPSNVTVVEGDFLETINEQPLATNDQRLTTNDQRPTTNDQRPTTNDQRPTTNDQIRVAGNLPYNVASPIMFKLVEVASSGVPLVDATLMLQREVADRLIARPGRKEYGVLSVLIQHSADVERLLTLPAGAFRPQPKVQSALVRLRFHPAEPPVTDAGLFERLVQAVFTRRRKTLANALLALPRAAQVTPATALRIADLDGRRRPETLTVAEFVRLADALSSVRLSAEP